MPPIKFKPSEKIYNRRTDTHSIKHNYIKNTPVKELFDYINSRNSKKKLIPKMIKEIERRGIKIKWNNKKKNTK